jgi:dipeptidyl aminopeptidase/acylaminoacyl peptidase
MSELAIESGGASMNAILYRPRGAGPHPVVVLLHGYPGNERNLDLAQALRRAGRAVLFFHYRGAWGSEGAFGFGNALADVEAAVALARSPAFAAEHGLDPGGLALVGHSMGGFLALHSGSRLDDVACVASLAGANLGLMGRAARADPAQARAAEARLGAWSGPIRGTTPERLVAELAENADAFDTLGRARALAGKPLLLVAGARDSVTPPEVHHEPLVAALRAAGATRLRDVVLDADHAFSDSRIALAREVEAWLREECPPR